MKILATNYVNPYVLETLRQMHEVVLSTHSDEAELCHLIQDCDILIVTQSVRICNTVLAAASRLKVIAHIGTSLENIDIDYVLSHGMRLLRVPQGNIRAMAETSFGIFMALSGRIGPTAQLEKRGQWFNSTLASYWLRGKTFGIVGAGEVSTYMARMAQFWGMQVHATLYQSSSMIEIELRERGIQISPLETLLQQADMICIHLPNEPEFQGLIGAEQINKIKSNSYLVNMASPYIFDLPALITALESQQGIQRMSQNIISHQHDPKLRTLLRLPNVMMVPYDFQQDFTSGRQMSDYLHQALAQYQTDDASQIALP